MSPVLRTVTLLCDEQDCPESALLPEEEHLQPWHAATRLGWTIQTTAAEVLTFCPKHRRDNS